MNTTDVSLTKPAGLVSIVIPCCGMLDTTKLCVPAVLRCSRDPLLFLDIGSLDGTAAYLAGLRDGLSKNLRAPLSGLTTRKRPRKAGDGTPPK